MKTPYWTALAPLVAVAAALARWLAQGADNVYTDADKQLYVPDPDLGWRLLEDGPVWLGLDAVAVCAAVFGAVVVGAVLVARKERRSGARSRLRVPLAGVGAVALVVPLWAFASGLGPAGARTALPARGFASAPSGAVDGALPDVSAGAYLVVEHDGTRITARVTAGGETFEARFSGGARGALRIDPRNFAQPVSADIAVDAASVDTGIELRSKHAREELRVDEFGEVRFALGAITGVAQDGPRAVAFTARGTIELMGRSHDVDVTGVLRAPDAAGRERLGVPDDDVLIVQARTSISIEASAIDNDGTFEADELPIDVSLVLVKTPTT